MLFAISLRVAGSEPCVYVMLRSVTFFIVTSFSIQRLVCTNPSKHIFNLLFTSVLHASDWGCIPSTRKPSNSVTIQHL